MIKYEGKVFRNLQEQVAKNMEDIETLKQYEGYMGPYATTSAIPEEDLNQNWLYLVGSAAPYELYKYNTDGTFTDLGLFPLAGPKGDTGEQGVSIVSVTKTGTSGLVDTYTITLSNGQTSTFTVTNGEKGDTGDTGPEGVGIVSITKTGTVGLVDTYTITLSNGQTSTFTVTNGAQGPEGQKQIYHHFIQIIRSDTTNNTYLNVMFECYNYKSNDMDSIADLCAAREAQPNQAIVLAPQYPCVGYYTDSNNNYATVTKIGIQTTGIQVTIGIRFGGGTTSVTIPVDDTIVTVSDYTTSIRNSLV